MEGGLAASTRCSARAGPVDKLDLPRLSILKQFVSLSLRNIFCSACELFHVTFRVVARFGSFTSLRPGQRGGRIYKPACFSVDPTELSESPV